MNSKKRSFFVTIVSFVSIIGSAFGILLYLLHLLDRDLLIPVIPLLISSIALYKRKQWGFILYVVLVTAIIFTMCLFFVGNLFMASGRMPGAHADLGLMGILFSGSLFLMWVLKKLFVQKNMGEFSVGQEQADS